MILSKAAGYLVMLLAVHNAAAGVVPLCSNMSLDEGRMSTQGVAQMEHHSGMPSAPGPLHQQSHHSSPGCVAMTACAPAGIAEVSTPQLVTPRVTVEHVAPAPALLASVFSTPETPPPIA